MSTPPPNRQHHLNLQGDVTGIYDSTGTKVVEYTYSAWGELLSVTGTMANTIGQIYPIRYRGYYYDTETGYYYLQSRYYDPETQRFLNADAKTDSNANILGYNLFVYAANNPINNFDKTGYGIIKNAIKWITKKVVKPVVKAAEKVWKKVVKGTTSTGVTATAAFGPSGTASVGTAYDNKGNIGITVSYGGGGGTPSAGIATYKTKTSASTIDKLEGTSGQIGGSFTLYGACIGAEYSVFADAESNEMYHGGTVFAGIGAPIPVELHGDVTTTTVVYSINIFEAFDELYNLIMKW